MAAQQTSITMGDIASDQTSRLDTKPKGHFPETGPDAPINLLKGWPNPSLLPAKELLEAASQVLTDPSIYVPGLEYGPDEGHEPLREALGTWLGDFYGPAVQQWRKSQSTTRAAAADARAADRADDMDHYRISPDRITVTGGASQSLGCILSAVTDPLVTRRAWIVAPAYFLAFKIFEDAGFAGRMRAVPELEAIGNSDGRAGPDTAWLEQHIKQVDAHWKHPDTEQLDRLKPTPTSKYPKVYKHVIYCVPNFANPSSVTTDIQTRQELVRIARKYDALLVCDDVYDMLQWPADTSAAEDQLKKAQVPRIVDVERYLDDGTDRANADGYGNVISNGSFSKICAPGVRVGWVEAAPKLAFSVSQAGTTKSGGAPGHLTSTYITKLVTSGILTKRINEVLQPAYARRYHSMMTAIHDHLEPLGFTLPQPGRDAIGGYFLWLRLPDELRRRGVTFVRQAEKEDKVIVSSGKSCEVPGDELQGPGEHDDDELQLSVARTKFSGYIRLCFSWEEEDRLAEGVRRLARTASRMLGEGHRAGDDDADEVLDMKDKC